MDATHFHLLLNHFPVTGTLLGSALLLWGIIKSQNNIKSAAAVILVLMAVSAIPVYLSGEPAEDSVEKLPGVSDSMIKLHENAATVAIWLMSITGIASLAALVFARKKRPIAKYTFVIAFGLSAICFAAMARTGYYGGQIRHTEIRSANAGNQGDEKENRKEAGEKDND